MNNYICKNSPYAIISTCITNELCTWEFVNGTCIPFILMETTWLRASVSRQIDYIQWKKNIHIIINIGQLMQVRLWAQNWKSKFYESYRGRLGH